MTDEVKIRSEGTGDKARWAELRRVQRAHALRLAHALLLAQHTAAGVQCPRQHTTARLPGHMPAISIPPCPPPRRPQDHTLRGGPGAARGGRAQRKVGVPLKRAQRGDAPQPRQPEAQIRRRRRQLVRAAAAGPLRLACDGDDVTLPGRVLQLLGRPCAPAASGAWLATLPTAEGPSA